MIVKRFISLLLLVAFAAAVFGGPTAHSTAPAAGPDETVTAESPAADAPTAPAAAPDVGAPDPSNAYEPTPAPCPTPTPASEPAAYLSNVPDTPTAPDRLHGTAAAGQRNIDNQTQPGANMNRDRQSGTVLRC